MKQTPSKLAIVGGTPRFAEPLYVGRPNLPDRTLLERRIASVLDSRQLTNHGPFVKQFEQELCRLTGARHCIATCNATIGLEMVVRAARLSGEVVVPSFTFVATPHALSWQHITPVFCDIDPHTHCLDVDRLEACLTPATTGILAVHTWGNSPDIHKLEQLASKHNLTLIFDAAHAIGCSHKHRMIGNFGDAEVFSFHATKIANTFEGGAITTNNDELAMAIRKTGSFGFVDKEHVDCIGTNGKMNEVSAAMGLCSLESLPDFIKQNQIIYHVYREQLADCPGVKLFPFDEQQRNNYHYLVLEIEESLFGLSRDQLLDVLIAENIHARRYFYPGCHQLEIYSQNTRLPLPHTERLCRSVLILPTGTTVTPDQAASICDLVRSAHESSDRLRNHFEQLAAR